MRNLKYMRKFAEFVADEEIVPTLSAQLSWSHNRHLLDKSKTIDEYVWYAIEREIEHELIANIAKTIMELGTGFAFMGNQ